MFALSNGRTFTYATALNGREMNFPNFPDGPRLAATTRIEITDAPIDDVLLVLSSGARVTGRVEVAGYAEFPLGFRPLKIWSVPGTAEGGDPNGKVREDGTFVLEGLIGERCLWIDGVDGWSARITDNGADMTNRPMSFPPGGQLDGVLIRFEPGSDASSSHPGCIAR